jgi:hypothetical protein
MLLYFAAQLLNTTTRYWCSAKVGDPSGGATYKPHTGATDNNGKLSLAVAGFAYELE